MRLLNTSTLSLEEFHGVHIPEYAILSHTWSAGELTYQEMVQLDAVAMSKLGFLKVRNFCSFAKDRGFDHAWVDTCCIDKQSSAELTEAINTMFTWYQRAKLCVVHLEDVLSTQRSVTRSRKQNQIDLLRRCRWFTRGWTLQELIASQKRLFVTGDWHTLDIDEAEVCSSITGIDLAVLRHERKLTQICVAERMSWAATRDTTRQEDLAYSLMGLFQVSMPILYGEGVQNAFRRLQEEIMKRSFDQTIFAWRGPYESSGLLARSPSDFRDTPNLSIWAPDALAPYSMTNAGILIRPCLFDVKQSKTSADTVSAMLQCDMELNGSWHVLAISLQRIPETYCWVNGKKCEAFRRTDCSRHASLSRPFATEKSEFAEIIVLEDEHFELVQQSVRDNEEKWSKVLQQTPKKESKVNKSAAEASTTGRIPIKKSSTLSQAPWMRRGTDPDRQTKFSSLEPVARRVQRTTSKSQRRRRLLERNDSDTIIGNGRNKRASAQGSSSEDSGNDHTEDNVKLCDVAGPTTDVITFLRLLENSKDSASRIELDRRKNRTSLSSTQSCEFDD